MTRCWTTSATVHFPGAIRKFNCAGDSVDTSSTSQVSVILRCETRLLRSRCVIGAPTSKRAPSAIVIAAADIVLIRVIAVLQGYLQAKLGGKQSKLQTSDAR